MVTFYHPNRIWPIATASYTVQSLLRTRIRDNDIYHNHLYEMKGIIIAVIALLVLGGGGYYYMTTQTPSTEPEGETMEDMDAMMEGMEGMMDHEGEMMMEHEGEEAAVTPTGKIIDITYSDKGFSPATFDAALGDTLKFTNNSTKDFWPASGPHENHASGGFAEFDAKDGIKSGGTYEIMMSKAGAWEFHNHFNEDHEGTVTVK